MKFFDLLSDEVTNRNVLTWIKTWDEVIKPNHPKVNYSIPESMKPQNYYNNKYSKGKQLLYSNKTDNNIEE